MSEQKMPALPEPNYYALGGASFYAYSHDMAERIKREAYEAGRQHERERLEPLRVAVEAVKKAEAARRKSSSCLFDINHESLAQIRAYDLLDATARALLETDR